MFCYTNSGSRCILSTSQFLDISMDTLCFPPRCSLQQEQSLAVGSCPSPEKPGSISVSNIGA